MKNRDFMSALGTVLFCLLILVVVGGCFPGPNYVETLGDQFETIKPEDLRPRAGFFRGLWHGIIAPVSFIISLLTSRISLYEVYNTGGWYDFGFVIGSGIIFCGGGFGSRSSRCKKRFKNSRKDEEQSTNTSNGKSNENIRGSYEDISDEDTNTEKDEEAPKQS